MNESNQIMTYNSRGHRPQINLPESFPSMDKIKEIRLVDHNGKEYLCKIIGTNTQTENLLDDSLACDNFTVDFEDIKRNFIRLTDDQRKIVMHVYYIYKNKDKSEENPKIILQGPAGTGKSTIINLIEKIITWEENKTSESPQKTKVLKCAYTGKAASNIEGETLNHLLSIPFYNTRSLAKKRLDSKVELLGDCVFFICDEMSMIGEDLLESVNMRLQQIFKNDKLYGDRFVLLVGDLYQIDPVMQKRIYPQSELWRCCDFYELNKVMRQQDENFIKALNNFRDSVMTVEDINLLRSREITNIDLVPDSVIHLSYLNKRVDEVNLFKINKSNEKEEIVNAIDDTEEWVPMNLRVKIGLRYLITRNLNIGDGLANCTTGIVKDFGYDSEGQVDVIWMKFYLDRIGKKTREEYEKKHGKKNDEGWVPIQRSTIVVKLKSDPKKTRSFPNKFPLKAAEALTVHKSQGQTYHEGVCIHLTGHKTDKLCTDKSLQYVALTRVERLEDLYIFGSFDYYSVRKSAKLIRTIKELNRLRNEKKLKLAYETFEDGSDDVIVFLNTGLTFSEHHGFVTSDPWYEYGSLLIFAETNTTESDNIEIPNFKVTFRSDYSAVRAAGTMICYKKENISVKVIRSIANVEKNIYLTLLLYNNFLYIIAGVKGDFSNDDFNFEIKNLLMLTKGKSCLLFIGNCNAEKNSLKSFLEFANNNNLEGKHVSNIIIDNGRKRDIVLSQNCNNISLKQFGVYEYIPSPHKPIYVKLPTVLQSSDEASQSSEVSDITECYDFSDEEMVDSPEPMEID